MFKLNGYPLLADDITVLTELKNQLEQNNIHMFSQFKIGQDNIQFTCPIHNGGLEKKPSCGITTVEKNGMPAGIVHCFACGYTATLEEMISHCFGRDDLGLFGRQWLGRNFLSVTVENRKPLQLDLQRDPTSPKSTFISEQELERYRFYHPYMWQRKLNEEVVEKFDVGYDDNFVLRGRSLKCLTFPVRDIHGRTLFVARRCVEQKLFNYPQGVDKPVYGLYELPKDCETVIICESIINALTCYVYGKPAVALLGLGTARQYEELRKLSCRKLITALDGDKAGRAATIKLKKAISNKIVTSFELPDGKDINDLSQTQFNELKEFL